MHASVRTLVRACVLKAGSPQRPAPASAAKVVSPCRVGRQELGQHLGSMGSVSARTVAGGKGLRGAGTNGRGCSFAPRCSARPRFPSRCSRTPAARPRLAAAAAATAVLGPGRPPRPRPHRRRRRNRRPAAAVACQTPRCAGSRAARGRPGRSQIAPSQSAFSTDGRMRAGVRLCAARPRKSRRGDSAPRGCMCKMSPSSNASFASLTWPLVGTRGPPRTEVRAAAAAAEAEAAARGRSTRDKAV